MKKNRCNVEVFSRVTGFFRPVQSWNEGKVEEFSDRNKFDTGVSSMISENDNCGIAETVTG